VLYLLKSVTRYINFSSDNCVINCHLILCLGQLKDAAAEIAKVHQSRQEAEQQVNASKVKMDVLSNYFKDKEKELMRLVGLHSYLLSCLVRVIG